jgi:predicted nucleotidyltransferase
VKTMAKIPKEPEEIFEEFTQDYQAVFGDDLNSIILYGSGARGEYIPKKSDLNFLIVLTEAAMDRLREALPLIGKWRKRRVNVPLFLTAEYIASSLDAFPVEFLNLRDSHVPVFGRDILKELSFHKRNIRLQCERELKGKLLLLREAYLDSEGKTRGLGQVTSASLTAFLSLFRALLFLRDREIPRRNSDLISTAAKEIGFDENPFMEVLRVKEGTVKVPREKMEGIVERYMQAIREVWKRVDQLEIKEVQR